MFYRTLACLPALTGAWRDRGGGLARSVGSWSDVNVDDTVFDAGHLAGGRPRRAVSMNHLGRALTTLDDPRGDGAGGVERQPAGHRAERRAHPAGAGARRPVLRGQRAVRDRHRSLRGRRVPGGHPDRADGRGAGVGPPLPGLERGRDRPAGGERAQHRAVATPGRGPWATPSPSCSSPTIPCWRRRCGASRWTICGPAAWCDWTCRRICGPTPRVASRRPAGRSELSSDALARAGHPALPTYVPAREGLDGDADLLARYPLALLTPKHHTRFLNSSYSHLPKHGPLEGTPFVELDEVDASARGIAEGDAVRVWNDRGALTLPARLSQAAAAGRGRRALRLVERPARRPGHRQLPHERHADGLGRRRGLLGHPGAGGARPDAATTRAVRPATPRPARPCVRPTPRR